MEALTSSINSPRHPFVAYILQRLHVLDLWATVLQQAQGASQQDF